MRCDGSHTISSDSYSLQDNDLEIVPVNSDWYHIVGNGSRYLDGDADQIAEYLHAYVLDFVE